MTLFNNVTDGAVLPTTIRFGSSGGPTTNTQVTHTGGGFRDTNRRWSQYQRLLQLEYRKAISSGKTDVLANALEGHYKAVGGPAGVWLVRDWTLWNTSSDQRQGGEAFTTATDQPLQNVTTDGILGDGSTRVFRMVYQSVAGTASHLERIWKPQNGTIAVAVGGTPQVEGSPTDFEINYSSGIVTFQTAPGAVAVTWGGAWYIAAAYIQDNFEQILRTWQTNGVGFPAIQVKLSGGP